MELDNRKGMLLCSTCLRKDLLCRLRTLPDLEEIPTAPSPTKACPWNGCSFMALLLSLGTVIGRLNATGEDKRCNNLVIAIINSSAPLYGQWTSILRRIGLEKLPDVGLPLIPQQKVVGKGSSQDRTGIRKSQ